MSLRFDSIRFHAIARGRCVMRRPAARCVAAALVLVVAGCAADAAVAPPPMVDDPHMYWALTLDHHAVTLSTVAPYDTIRLTATPRTFDGTVLPDLPAPTYTSLDVDRAVVSPDGLVRVLKRGTKIPVVASLAVGNLRHADTAFLNVTTLAAPPVLASFSIQPIPPDSAKTVDPKTIEAHAKEPDSTEITGLAVYYTVSDPTTATIDRAAGILRKVRPGHVTVTATATAYGVTKMDTVTYILGYPVMQAFTISAQMSASGRIINGFSPAQVELAAGGTVLFTNLTAIPTDVTFDDPTNVAQNDEYCGFLAFLCGSGSIAGWTRDPNDPSGLTASRVRRFPVPGTYTFRNTIFGTMGTIVVIDDSTLR